MFDKNWNILIVLFIIVLVVAYFKNCYEGFAVSNDEAIANVAALYNKDNMTVTNLATTGKFVADGNGKVSITGAPGNKIIVETPNKLPLYINDGVNIGVDGRWIIDNNGAAQFSSINNNGRITTNELAVKGVIHSNVAATGEVTASGRLWSASGDLCLGDVCINKEHLRQLRDRDFNGLTTVRGILRIQEDAPGHDAYIDFLNHNGTRKQWFGYSYGGANRTL